MRSPERGQVLPVVMICLVMLTLIIAGLVNWIQYDSKTGVKQQKSASAMSFAEAAIDRGTWKLQSTTATWSMAAGGTVIPNYNFDKTFTDIPGGSYRIKFSPAANQSVTIVGEGRDINNRETRAISAVFKNQTIYSPLMASGNITWAIGLTVFWGPLVSQGDIELMDNTVGSFGFPRKYAHGVVYTGPAVSAVYQRDVNGLVPPNTDGSEWWSAYPVPNVPVLDFVALRSSAAASGTLNIYGCKNSTFHGATAAVPNQGGIAGPATWDARASCNTRPGNITPHNQHFGDSWDHPTSPQFQGVTDYVWYWDGDVTLMGDSSNNTGLRGTFIVRGNLTIDTPGQYNYTGHVPATAWQEQQKLQYNTNDTGSAGEYPADIGFHASTGVFHFGTDSFNVPGLGGGPYVTTVGLKGFTYVGGNLNIYYYMDFNGAVWVNGAVNASGGSISNSCGVFYDDTLVVPALNVILLRQSWQEAAPSPTAWP